MKITVLAASARISRLLMLGLLLLGTIPSCKHEIPQPTGQTDDDDDDDDDNSGGGNGGGGIVTNPCDSDSIYFNLQVLPILVSNCAMNGCHSAASAMDGVILSSYQSVMGSDIVSPGDPEDSDLYEVLVETDPDKRMPPNGPLSSQQIQLIQTWIAQGAQNLNCDNGGCDTSNVTWSATVRPIIDTNCKGCHTAASPSGGVVLDNYSAVANTAFNGSLLGSVQHSPGWTSMPFGGSKLSDCDIAKIRIWVNAGSPNN
jgi:hypothetical protein